MKIYFHTYDAVGKIRVKCNQTGKLFSMKVTTLCREDGDPLEKDDLVEGTQLVMTLPYSVTFQEIISPLAPRTKSKYLRL